MDEPEGARSSGGLSGLFGLLWRVVAPGRVRHGAVLAAGFAAAVAASLCALAAPVVLQGLIDEVVPRRDLEEFLWHAGYLVATYLGFFGLWAVQVWLTVLASERIFRDLRERVVAAILDKSTAFFRTYASGDILTRLVNDLDVVATFFYENVVQAVVSLAFAGLIVAFILAWHWMLGLLCLVCIPFYLLVIWRVHGPIARRSGLARRRLSEQNAVLFDTLAGQREIRFFQQQRAASQRFGEAAAAYTGAAIRAMLAGQLSLTAVESVGILVRVVPFLVGGLLIVLGSDAITTGVLVAYFTYLTHLTTNLAGAFEGLTKLAQVQPSLVRIQQLLDFPAEPVPAADPRRAIPADTTLRLADVAFAFRPDHPIFTRLNLTVAGGEKLAVMAPSGSGKSTLVDLLLRFREPQTGTITLGGVDSRHIALPVWLTYFSHVAQKTHLFNLSVAENIAMGWYGVPADQIRRVARLVRMDRVIEALPEGYDTRVGEGGVTFSGGQLQRLAIARALVRDPEILVLDEFTSALDRTVEDEILTDLLAGLAGRTVICITHSEQVAARFDRVVYLPEIAHGGG
ncbi:ABC transporter permease [Allostella sp. ATCC 35155]|nr:ABC transporter permease [Stella sp. ATCC 35155]